MKHLVLIMGCAFAIGCSGGGEGEAGSAEIFPGTYYSVRVPGDELPYGLVKVKSEEAEHEAFVVAIYGNLFVERPQEIDLGELHFREQGEGLMAWPQEEIKMAREVIESLAPVPVVAQ